MRSCDIDLILVTMYAQLFEMYWYWSLSMFGLCNICHSCSDLAVSISLIFCYLHCTQTERWYAVCVSKWWWVGVNILSINFRNLHFSWYLKIKTIILIIFFWLWLFQICQLSSLYTGVFWIDMSIEVQICFCNILFF